MREMVMAQATFGRWVSLLILSCLSWFGRCGQAALVPWSGGGPGTSWNTEAN